MKTLILVFCLFNLSGCYILDVIHTVNNSMYEPRHECYYKGGYEHGRDFCHKEHD